MPHFAGPLGYGQGPRMHPLLPYRTSILSLIKLCFLALLNLPTLRASPLGSLRHHWSGDNKANEVGWAIENERSWSSHGIWTMAEEPESQDPNDPTLWIYLTVAMALVLLGGAFAGLTIALMGQDEIYLQVIKTSGEGPERKHAARVLRLLARGKHWVLVTLLLSNVITNETLPIVLDRSLGGGWPAVLGSTVLIVIFGEIIPQSICVRYGLPIGAWMSAPVLVLMYIMAPVAWPTAKLLDKLLGTGHGTTYKKAGLKTLVTLHKTLGEAGEQLNSDEVTIISAVLDLKDKPVGAIMTPMDNVFTMSANTVLDEKTMDVILSAGYSRIPIHAPDNPVNFIGMLLVKMLITYDPEDCKPVRDFSLATLPETRPETSCLDIVNYFQEGKSHMVLVTDFPGEDTGALGVVTLEDVIEELIGEEIIDESDVFVDVHKAIRRMTPAPWTRVPRHASADDGLMQVDSNGDAVKTTAIRRLASHDGVAGGRSRGASTGTGAGIDRTAAVSELARSPVATVTLRRSSSIACGSEEMLTRRADAPELRDHLRHLGPSNLASRPKSTRYTSVKIKPGGAPPPTSHAIADTETAANTTINATIGIGHSDQPVTHPLPHGGGVGEGLIASAGRDAKDGALAVQAGYGTISPPRHETSHHHSISEQAEMHNRGTQVSQPFFTVSEETPSPGAGSEVRSGFPDLLGANRPLAAMTLSQQSLAQHLTPAPSHPSSRHHSRVHSASTVDSLGSTGGGGVGESRATTRRPARSGSITENIVESGGFRKVVLEMTSSSSSLDGGLVETGDMENGASNSHQKRGDSDSATEHKAQHSAGGGGKRRKKRRKARKGAGAGAGSGDKEPRGHGGGDEGSPLLGRQ